MVKGIYLLGIGLVYLVVHFLGEMVGGSAEVIASAFTRWMIKALEEYN